MHMSRGGAHRESEATDGIAVADRLAYWRAGNGANGE
jgi:hypothetical protein